MDQQVLSQTLELQPWKQQKRPPAKRFVETPGDATFAQIRQRLQRLTLNSEYKKGLEHFKDNTKIHNVNQFHHNRTSNRPQRVSSFGSRDSIASSKTARDSSKEGPLPHKTATRPTSKHSFLSDDIEYKNVRKRMKEYYSRTTEADHSQKGPGREGIVTPKRHPELFASQIRLKDGEHGRSSSPKSRTSDSSSGMIHLGLIDSLDLKEPLNDLDKLKERYSNDQFMNSLTLYKLRGHDRCFHTDAFHSEHVPRGAKLYHSGDKIGPRSSPDSMKGSTMSLPAMFKVTPRDNSQTMQHSQHNHNHSQHNHIHSQDHNQSHNQDDKDKTKDMGKQWRKVRLHSNIDQTDTKKRVEFDVTPKATTVALPPMSPFSFKEPKSILKKREGTPDTSRSTKRLEQQSVTMGDDEDDFLLTANHGWRYHLPKLHSPPPTPLRKHPSPFRGKMYHCGDGISHEFETVIDKYGNCRQSSILREASSVKSKSQNK